MLKWILDNKDWLFSGVGIVAIAAVLGFFVKRKSATSAAMDESQKPSSNTSRSASAVKQRWRLKFRTVRLWLRQRLLARVVPDGFAFFEEQTEITAKSGGEIFTTAIFENYSRGDKVREKLLNIPLDSPREPKHVTFTRLVFLDDPTQEWTWIRAFLSLKSEITPDTNGFVFHPEILRIPSSNRPFVHRLMAALPRITLTLIKRNGPKQYFVYIGFPNPSGENIRNFGILFRTKYMHEQTMNFINKYSSGAGQLHIQKYTDVQHLPNIDFSERGLTIRILDALQELSYL